MVPWQGQWTHDVYSDFFDDAANEGDDLSHDSNLPPGVDQPMEDNEPQAGRSGMTRHTELNTSTTNEENFMSSLPIGQLY
ncbi:unnamed protein product [Danaus chrysippus]|uniref:(African queen) hypothetical protein n=1 Tax=Danaus chrysippus TaxID=151541 RepID=A0A8J2R7V6_9NEOP|nr:unnamed protein product [Danaus chrysippus]